jgi:multidrug efflux pump subunit AcrA (membrane-fusion protein)
MTKRTERRLKWALSIGVLVAAAGVAFILVATKEEPPRAEKPLEGTLVEVIQIGTSTHDVDLHAKGTVVPAKEIVLQAELGGRVIWQSPELVAGGRFKTGQPMVRIDPRDYQLAVESYRSRVNRAKLDLSIEARRGEVAKREWNAFGEMDVSDEQRALAQREPQLEANRLALKAAQSALKKAQLDLTRATLRAPFNAMVVSESVDTGQASCSARKPRWRGSSAPTTTMCRSPSPWLLCEPYGPALRMRPAPRPRSCSESDKGPSSEAPK